MRRVPQVGRALRRSGVAWWLVLLAGCGMGQMALNAFAEGTAAGTSISNTATATYTDPNNPSETLNSTSNTVTVTIAEVAGVTVTPIAIQDSTPSSVVLPNDVLSYDFLVTNVGNDPTQFTLPDAASVTGPGTRGTLQYSTDGGNNWINMPNGGLTTAVMQPNGSIRVRVPVTVDPTAPSGAPLIVVLGNTGGNDGSAGTQNQPFPTNPAGNDVRTLDNADGSTAGEVNGAPANGEREASGFQRILVGAQPFAFALLHKNRTGYATAGTPALTDDLLTYGFSLQVMATSPSGASASLIPADLAGTPVTVDGSLAPRVLISDAIPAGTVLNAPATPAAGWTAVYTASPLTTLAHQAAWTATPPGNLALLTRVGFVTNGPVTKGAAVNGFSIQVVTSGINATGSNTIANMAQSFGQTAGAQNALVYDESGDAMPSNLNDDGTQGSNVPTNGVASPGTNGIDTNNTNTGVGPGGEDNTYVIAPAGTIVTGPNGAPGAVGPTDNNDDFTNLSAPVAANTAPNSTIDPAVVTFTNTLQNQGGTTLSKLLLVPIAPTVPGALPAGTTATLTYGSLVATYTYNGTVFTFTSGVALEIPSLAAGVSISYTVAVNLPAATALSTDTGSGYPVPVRAFVDTNLNGAFDTGESQNVTIDRVYTGFLRLVKQARILDTDGTSVVQDFSNAPVSANVRPGRFIEYRITYTNISTPPQGTANVILNAANVVITEDGTALPNNWATDQDNNGKLDTSNVAGTAADSGAASIGYFSGTNGATAATDQTGTTATTDVTKYIDTVNGTVAPGVSRTFGFRRKIN